MWLCGSFASFHAGFGCFGLAWSPRLQAKRYISCYCGAGDSFPLRADVDLCVVTAWRGVMHVFNNSPLAHCMSCMACEDRILVDEGLGITAEHAGYLFIYSAFCSHRDELLSVILHPKGHWPHPCFLLPQFSLSLPLSHILWLWTFLF